jgi:lipoprotein-anchoring transpeptidase ErfK/SrfK
MSSILLITGPSVAVAKDGEGSRAFRERMGSARETEIEFPYPENPPKVRRPVSNRLKLNAYGQNYDPKRLPPPESTFDYPVKAVDPSLIDSVFRRQVVEFDAFLEPGTIIVDPKAHFLYRVLGNRQAMRYGVGVGRDGFAWSGNAEIRMKRRWPRWVPPKEMVDRDKRAKKWVNGQPGGPGNPLGARSVSIFGGKDTLYRIHGTTAPQSIGKSLSSGCVRMLNEDVADLFDQVRVGTKVIVRS